MRMSPFPFGRLLLASMLLAAVGCGRDNETVDVPTGGPKVPHATHAHGHGAGPHKGHLIELGDKHEYHAEILFDDATRKTTIYILGKDAKTAAPLDSGAEIELHLVGEPEVEVKLTAQPLEGEAEGKSSRFVVEGQLPDSIKSEEQFEGHLHVTAGELALEGEITHKEHGHDDHGHEHGDEHKDEKAPGTGTAPKSN